MSSGAVATDVRPVVPGRRRLAGALILVTTLGVVACGGTPEVKLPGPDSPTPALSKVEYVTRANEICRATTKLIAQRTEDLGPATMGGSQSADQEAELHRATQEVAAVALTRLRNLTPPPADAVLVQRGIDTMQTYFDTSKTDAQRPVDPVALIEPELFDYGLTGCFAKR
jgi:hypothetical protein